MTATSLDISPAFRQHLVEHTPLADLLTFDGEVHIHKGHAPQQDQLLDVNYQLAEDPTCQAAELLVGVRPYIWYEQSGEEAAGCINGDKIDQPVTVTYDIEVVSFDLDLTDAIARELTKAIGLLGWNGQEIGCMAGMKVQTAMISSQSDSYETINTLAADLGGYVRTLLIDIKPWWWS